MIKNTLIWSNTPLYFCNFSSFSNLNAKILPIQEAKNLFIHTQNLFTMEIILYRIFIYIFFFPVSTRKHCMIWISIAKLKGIIIKFFPTFLWRWAAKPDFMNKVTLRIQALTGIKKSIGEVRGGGEQPQIMNNIEGLLAGWCWFYFVRKISISTLSLSRNKL